MSQAGTRHTSTRRKLSDDGVEVDMLHNLIDYYSNTKLTELCHFDGDQFTAFRRISGGCPCSVQPAVLRITYSNSRCRDWIVQMGPSACGGQEWCY